MIDDFMHILSWQQNMKNINNEQKNIKTCELF